MPGCIWQLSRMQWSSPCCLYLLADMQAATSASPPPRLCIWKERQSLEERTVVHHSFSSILAHCAPLLHTSFIILFCSSSSNLGWKCASNGGCLQCSLVQLYPWQDHHAQIHLKRQHLWTWNIFMSSLGWIAGEKHPRSNGQLIEFLSTQKNCL